VEARVADAHGACGNGVEWALEHWTPGRRSALRSGSVDNGGTASIEPVEALDVRLGDVVFLRVDARNGDHVCDLTAIDLRIEELSEAAKSHISGGAKKWTLARDVSGDILAGNPHADAFGNASVWSFVRGESAERSSRAASIPTGSALARWLKAVERGDGADRAADDVAHLLSEEPSADALPADRDLRKTLRAVDGPLLGGLDLGSLLAADSGTSEPLSSGASFGTKPWGGAGRPDCIYVQAPAVIRWTLPADVARGRELVVRGALESEDGGDGGSVQVEIARESPQDLELRPGPAVIARQDPASLDAWKRAFEEFRSVFPRALAYARVVPVDEVITLVLYHREDEPLVRLCLPPDEGAELDRLWRELRFVSQDAFKIHRSFDMFQGFASQEGRVPEFEPLRRPIRERAEAFERELLASEPSHLDAVVAFARRAWRRPFDAGDRDRILEPYRAVRALGHPHDEAIRAALTAVLVAPGVSFQARAARSWARALSSQRRRARRAAELFSLGLAPRRAPRAFGGRRPTPRAGGPRR
jgi:hypothetical protein